MKISTSAQFKGARHKLGLSVSQVATLCRVDERTVRRWEQPPGMPSSRDPHPSACVLMERELEKANA